jgi:predicted acylesterase/phospholipase RssA
MPEVALALSGGGVRAMLFGLGALRAVVRASGDDRKLTVLAGVSGGAVGAAYAASRLDIGNTTLETYDTEVLRPVLQTVTTRSIMFATGHVTAIIVGVILALFGAVVVGAFGLGLPGYARILVVLALLLVAILIAGWRGIAIEASMRSVLFPANPGLQEVDGQAHLVLQATDLGSGEATYLTSRGVRSWRWGDADARDLRLVRAARAAATFPGVFPALHLGPFAFSSGADPKPPKRVALVDGGVYDNMGSEWLLSETRTLRAAYKIVVNASANLSTVRGGFGVIGLGELSVLKREKDIQYDGTTAPRRRWLQALFDVGHFDGTLVRIDGNLREWVQKYAGRGDERARRAQNMAEAMDAIADPTVWERWAQENRRVKTAFGKLCPAVALDLARAGYLAAMIQTHVLEGWPAPETCDPEKLFVDALTVRSGN